jgi:hypothetical protein
MLTISAIVTLSAFASLAKLLSDRFFFAVLDPLKIFVIEPREPRRFLLRRNALVLWQ